MNRKESQKLLDSALELEDENKEASIKIYQEIIEQDPLWSIPYYNLGLIYKYNNQWQQSYEYNLRATELENDYKPALWNLGIASTALKKWKSARKAWIDFGIELEDNEGEVFMKIGAAPIRLKNEEVIWANRICPARARIISIPLKESGRRYADIILNDGAPTGKRIYNGREYSVFDELELIEASEYQTYSIGVKVGVENDLEKLWDLCDESDMGFENWTSSVYMICKQCSEGIPHKTHDKDLVGQEFGQEKNIAIASKSRKVLDQVLKIWTNQNEVIVNWID